MMFKLSTLVLAAAALVAGSPIEKRGTAYCTYLVTSSGVPDTSVAELSTEWNYLIGRNFVNHIPDGTVIDGTNSEVSGPNATGEYTVVKAVGTDAVTNAEAIGFVTGWVGSTFDGPWSGVTWTIKSVTCKV